MSCFSIGQTHLRNGQRTQLSRKSRENVLSRATGGGGLGSGEERFNGSREEQEGQPVAVMSLGEKLESLSRLASMLMAVLKTPVNQRRPRKASLKGNKDEQ